MDVIGKTIDVIIVFKEKMYFSTPETKSNCNSMLHGKSAKSMLLCMVELYTSCTSYPCVYGYTIQYTAYRNG